MDWAQRVRSYRSKSQLTQEALADLFGVDVRSVRRWEAGSARPSAAVRSKLVRAPVQPIAVTSLAGFSSMIETSSAFSVLLDYDHNVITCSPSYEARMQRVLGPDWRSVPMFERFYRPISEQVQAACDRHGGLDRMMRQGLSSMTHDFVLQRNGAERAFRFTSARLFINAQESVSIHTSFGIDKSAASFTDPLITYLEEIRSDEE
jgi:transcriptional regulator with XRE-family HTH domain